MKDAVQNIRGDGLEEATGASCGFEAVGCGWFVFWGLLKPVVSLDRGLWFATVGAPLCPFAQHAQSRFTGVGFSSFWTSCCPVRLLRSLSRTVLSILSLLLCGL